MRSSHVISLLAIVSGTTHVDAVPPVMPFRFAFVIGSRVEAFCVLSFVFASPQQDFMLLRIQAELRSLKKILLPLLEV